MQNHIRIRRDIVALEAFTTADIGGLFKKIIPDMAHYFSDFVGLFNHTAPALVLTSKQSKFLSEIQKYSFMDIETVGAYVPEGMKVEYLTYISVMTEQVDHVTKMMEEVLNPFSVYLGRLINNEDQKLSTVSEVTQYKGLQLRRERMNSAHKDCFIDGSTEVSVTIGNVVSRNNDWRDVFHLSNELFNKINHISRPAVAKKMNECKALLDVLTNKVKRGEFVESSPETISNIAEGTYQVACELEFFSAVFFRVQTLCESLNRTVNHFTDVMKD